jgi:prepilin-type processing-associated H-X9-DG protein
MANSHPVLPTRDRFSVVELVLILTILLSLVSLLLPAIHRGKMLARSGVCADNLRKLGVWVNMYSTANDAMLPAYEAGWIMAIARAAGQQVDQGVAPTGILSCPSQGLRPPGDQDPISWWRGSNYGINQHLTSNLRDSNNELTPYWALANTRQIKDPSGKLLLADSAGGNFFGIPDRDPTVAGISRFGEGYSAGLPPDPAIPLPYMRHHEGSANVLFVDGHGEVKRSWPALMLGPGTSGFEFWHAEHDYPGSKIVDKPAGTSP